MALTLTLGLGFGLAGCRDTGPDALTAKTLAQWMQRTTRKPLTAVAAARPKPRIYVDTERVARTLPQWALAAELTKLSPPQPARKLVVTEPSSGPSSGAWPVPSLSFVEPHPAAIGATEVAVDFGAAQLRDPQKRALSLFLAAAEQRQAALAREETALAQRALQLRILAAQRGEMTPLEPVQLSPEEQARITNLRLSLLRNVQSTPAQKEQAQAELNALLDAWAAELRAQESAHQAAIIEATQRLPERMKVSGEAEIAMESAARDATRRQQREAIEADQNAALKRDLDPQSLRLAAHLEAVPHPPPGWVGPQPPARSAGPAQPGRGSWLPLTSPAGGSALPDAAGQVARLQQEARANAAQLARLAALRLGAQLGDRAHSLDRTQWLLQQLKAG